MHKQQKYNHPNRYEGRLTIFMIIIIVKIITDCVWKTSFRMFSSPTIVGTTVPSMYYVQSTM